MLYQKLKKNNILISYDPNYRALLWNSEENAIEKMRSVIKYVDIMKISDEETELLTDEKNPSKAGEILLNQGVSCVVITLGENGAIFKTKDFEIQLKGKERKVVDTTGAGDSFWGAILYKFLNSNKKPCEITEKEGYEFLKFANIVAGLCGRKKRSYPCSAKTRRCFKRIITT